MKITIGQRVKEVLLENGKTQVDLVRSLNWDKKRKAAINLWLNQKKEHGYAEFLQGVVNMFPQIDIYWLLTGESEMIPEKSNDDQVESNNIIEEKLSPYNKSDNMTDTQFNRMVDSFEKQLEEKDKIINRLLTMMDGEGKKKEAL